MLIFAIALLIASIGLPVVSTDAGASAIIANHYSPAEFDMIPATMIDVLKDNTGVLYGHTSHGSQIISGMEIIREEDPLYEFGHGPDALRIEQICGGVGLPGDTTWVEVTRQRLLSPGSGISVVMWSWCHGCSNNDEEAVNKYLNNMTRLEAEFPGVTFVYMTAHLDGTGPGGNLHQRNSQIRNYVRANSKILFDFADIESFDPDGNYYPNGSDACEWCDEWCASHDCPDCDDCAHSHCFNCYLKGKAFWWLLARIAGWNTPVATETTTWGSIKATFR